MSVVSDNTTLEEARVMADRNEPLPEAFYLDANGDVQFKPGRNGTTEGECPGTCRLTGERCPPKCNIHYQPCATARSRKPPLSIIAPAVVAWEERHKAWVVETQRQLRLLADKIGMENHGR